MGVAMTQTPQLPGPADREFARYRQTRDPDALARVFDATATRLLLVAMHLVRDAGEAEDLVQATFVDAMRNADRYDPTRPVLPWLTGILTKQAAWVRRQGRRQPDRERAQGPADEDPVRLAADREVSAEVLRALDGLPVRYRQVLVLRLVHGLRGTEIARALDTSPETVRSRLHRALGLLRRALPEDLALPALAFAALEASTGKGLAALRAAVHELAQARLPAAARAASCGVAAARAATLAIHFLMKKLVLSLGVSALLLAVGGAILCLAWPGVDPSRDDAASLSASTKPARSRQAVLEDVAQPRRELAVPADSLPDGQRLRVLVIDGETGLPEPGAEVLSCSDLDVTALSDVESSEYESLARRSLFFGGIEAQARRFGRSWITGADGAVCVPRPTNTSSVFAARAGGRYGEAAGDREASDLCIELHRDHTLRLRVVDRAGVAAADVPLCLAVHWPGQLEPQLLDLGSTDAAGALAMPHVQLRLQAAQRMHELPPRRLAVVPKLPGVRDGGVDVGLQQLAGEPLVVRLPPTGRLVVELRHDGKACCSRFVVNLQEAAEAGDARSPLQLARSSQLGATSFGPRVVFAHVGLGARFAVQASVPGVPLPVQHTPGPHAAGEEVVVRLDVPEIGPVLRVRVADADGEPIRRQELAVWLQIGDETKRYRAPADEDGTVRVALERGCADQQLLACQFELERAGRPTGRVARVRLDRGLTIVPDLDLGALRLQEAPRVGSGMVVDDAGRPVHGITLEVRPIEPGGGPVATPEPPVTAYGKPDGTFVACGFTEAEEMVVRTRGGNGLGPAELRFRRGATDLRLVLPRSGKVMAELTHDLGPDQVRLLRLQAVGADGRTHVGQGGGPLQSDRYRLVLSNLAPGRYAVQVCLLGETLAALDAVEVGPGPATDPRLASIDLRGRFRLVRVHVSDDRGQPIDGGGRFELQPGASFGSPAVPLVGSTFLLPLASRSASGVIEIPGWRRREVHDVDGDRTVRLEPALTIRARLAADLPLPPGVTLHAFVRPEGYVPNPLEAMFGSQRGAMAHAGTAGEPQADGSFLFRLAAGGKQEFRFVLSGSASGDSVALPIGPGAVVIAPAPASQELTFTVDAEAVQRALLAVAR